ncbi:fibrobacter succinogenes major domain family protein, partial [Bacteroides fragilis str. 2-F-2 
FYSTYTGNKTTNNTDPCSKLNTAYYGTGWRTPSENDYIPLSRCTDKVLTNGGMWFMNKSIGIFLLASGSIGWGGGCSTGSATIGEGTIGEYWSSTKDGNNQALCFAFYNDGTVMMFSDYQATGIPVRCVK